jgi:hypothetical protein
MPEESKVTFLGTNPPGANVLLDQYKAYVADIGNIGVRYTAAQTFYFALVSALIGVLAFKDAGQPIAQYVNLKFTVVMCFIAAVCYVWRRTLLFYHSLFRAKFATLRDLEKLGLYNVYAAEGDYMMEPPGGTRLTKFPSLIDSEVRIPLEVMCIAILLAIASAGYLVCTN